MRNKWNPYPFMWRQHIWKYITLSFHYTSAKYISSWYQLSNATKLGNGGMNGIRWQNPLYKTLEQGNLIRTQPLSFTFGLWSSGIRFQLLSPTRFPWGTPPILHHSLLATSSFPWNVHCHYQILNQSQIL